MQYLPGEKMDRKEIEFEFERATKNTYRFQEMYANNVRGGKLEILKNWNGDWQNSISRVIETRKEYPSLLKLMRICSLGNLE